MELQMFCITKFAEFGFVWSLDHCERKSGQILTETPPGSRSLHVQKHTCSNCGYPSKSIRKCTLLQCCDLLVQGLFHGPKRN